MEACFKAEGFATIRAKNWGANAPPPRSTGPASKIYVVYASP
jgi:hypothetical protein